MSNGLKNGKVVFEAEKSSDTTFFDQIQVDEYEIGGEKNAPIGGTYYHVTNPKTVKISEDAAKRLFESNENVDIFNAAKERFGLTRDIRECGYVLPSGEMLDFSGRNYGASDHGSRHVDHRDISDLNFLEDGNTKSGLDISMETFIRMGAIRIHCSRTWSMINLFNKPTKKQQAVLASLIRYADCNVTVEVGDGNESYCYGDYEGVSPRRVLADIDRYFDDGIKFKGNVLETFKNNKSVILEYLDKNYNLPLYRYFKWANNASDDELCEDLIYECPWAIPKLAEKLADRFPEFYEFLEYDSCEGAEDYFLELVKKNKLSYWVKCVISDVVDVYELPSWYTCDFVRLVKNEWCIHFGNDAYSIAREGFTSGTEEIERLAYTGAGEKKPYKGYDFAYSIESNDRQIDNGTYGYHRHGHKYGNEAVIFRTSGVEVFHYGDNEKQVIFYGPYAKDFIPMTYNDVDDVWVVYGNNNQVLKSGTPTEIAYWAEQNLPQYRKQILMGKNGKMPIKFDTSTKKYKYAKNYDEYPFNEERMVWYLNDLKHDSLNEEVVADGSANSNPYAKRWKAEREALKNFIRNNGALYTSKENGKQYFVYVDYPLSNLIGYNYCLCLQWDPITRELGSTPYIRALDKFTRKIFRPTFDTRGMDNIQGTYDDLV